MAASPTLRKVRGHGLQQRQQVDAKHREDRRAQGEYHGQKYKRATPCERANEGCEHSIWLDAWLRDVFAGGTQLAERLLDLGCNDTQPILLGTVTIPPFVQC